MDLKYNKITRKISLNLKPYQYYWLKVEKSTLQ